MLAKNMRVRNSALKSSFYLNTSNSMIKMVQMRFASQFIKVQPDNFDLHSIALKKQ